MPEITAALVKSLREKTDLPMMDCKRALEENGGDVDKAIEYLQKKHRGKLETKADRETGEGRIGVFIGDGVAGIAEIRCETAQVAKSDPFIKLCNEIAAAVARQSESAPADAAVLGVKLPDGRSVKDAMGDVFGKVGENMRIARARRVPGLRFGSYVHHDGKTGVLVAVEGKPTTPDVLKDLCQHIAFSKPAGIRREDIPGEKVNEVREMARSVAREEGKPAQIVEKIAEGKVNAWFAERVLLEQEHVKVTKTKVGDVLKQGGITGVTAMVVMVVGGH
jgi:elongation factor Ts